MANASLTVQRDAEKKIFILRGMKVILDADLAALYGVRTHRLNEQVKRNAERFPADFVFQLTENEAAGLISRFAISKSGRGGRRSLPFAFTEHGALMAASVLNSPRAVETGILVVRAFVKLKGLLAVHRQLAAQLRELELRLSSHDEQIGVLFDAIRKLMSPPETPRPKIGF
jgi:hypothetical protein